jgi:hypothetical protein
MGVVEVVGKLSSDATILIIALGAQTPRALDAVPLLQCDRIEAEFFSEKPIPIADIER